MKWALIFLLSLTILYAQDVPPDNVVKWGDPTSMFVVATGTEPLRYQWYKEDGTPIAGAVTDTLYFPALSESDIGGYYVIVSNDAGSVQSRTAYVKKAVAPSNAKAYFVVEQPTRPTNKS